jgi:putative SOS response-associated peptidase YedK
MVVPLFSPKLVLGLFFAWVPAADTPQCFVGCTCTDDHPGCLTNERPYVVAPMHDHQERLLSGRTQADAWLGSHTAKVSVRFTLSRGLKPCRTSPADD